MPIIIRAIRGTSISRPGKIWIPQLRDTVKAKIEINDIDVTADSLPLTSFTWPTLRNALGNFNVTLNNNERKYLEVFEEGHIVKFYADFTDATTQIFEGKMEEPRYGFQTGFKTIINGMKNPELATEPFTGTFTDASASQVLQDVLNDTFPNTFTFNNLDANMTTAISPAYEEESVISVLKDILERVNFDGYIDVNDDVHTFPDTGVVNVNEAAIQGQNVLAITPFGRDTLRRRNVVRGYGGEVEDCPIINTQNTSTDAWNKTEIINTSSTTINDLTERVLAKLNLLGTLNQEGGITCSALATLRPGNKIPCRIPNANIEGDYFIPQYTQELSTSGGWKTTILNNKVMLDIPSIHFEHKLAEEARELNNPNNMKNTLILLTFDNENDISVLSNSIISNGKLIIESGDTGEMTSNTFININDFTSVEIRGIANDDFLLGPSFIRVSNNSGVDFKTINNFKELTDLSSTGNKGVIEVTIKSDASFPNPSLDSICLLVNT